MSITISKLTFRISISLALALIAVIVLLGSGLPLVSSSIKPAKKSAVRLVSESTPYVTLQEGRELEANYASAGTMSMAGAMKSSATTPTALASGDVDRDGFPDLVCGYASNGTGLLTIHRGDKRSFAPEDPEVIEGIKQGRFPDPYLKDATTVELPVVPDFIGTGDFTRDSNLDLVAATRGGNTLYIFEGDGQGGFPILHQLILPGTVTTMLAGDMNYQDGLADVMIGLDSPAGASLLVYDSKSNLIESAPTEYTLPALASSIALGNLDEDQLSDLAIVARGQVVILHGRNNSGNEDVASVRKAGKLEPVDLQFKVKALALGEFIWDRGARTEMAMLGDDGVIHIATRGELDTRPLTAEEVLAERQEMARLRERQDRASSRGERVTTMSTASTLSEPLSWSVVEDVPQETADPVSLAARASEGDSSQPLLVSARISTLPSDDLVIMNPVSSQVQVLYRVAARRENEEIATQSVKRDSFMLESDSEPIAVLPVRLDVMAQPGLVIMRKGQTSPEMVLAAAAATFTVTSNTDFASSANPTTCASGAGGTCSLREAVETANFVAGADMITFTSNAPTLTITGSDNASANGDLDINDSVTIMGNGSGTTIINTTYAAGCGDCKVFGVNQSGTFPGLAVSFTGVTIQNGFNDHNATGSFQETGGGIDFFLTGTGCNYSMTNCIVTSNEARTEVQSYGGGINIDSGSPSLTNHGSVSFTGTTISNNICDSTGGGLNLFADIHTVTFSGCTISGNSTLATGGLGAQGGGIKIRHTNGGTVTIQSSTMITGNTAKGQGGGIDYITGNTGITFTINTATISNNTSQSAGTASSAGGGISISGNATLTGVTVSGNHADQSAGGGNSIGGGILMSGGTVTMNNTCSITNNTSNGTNGKGGGLQINGGNITLTGVTISGNQAAGDGGGILLDGTGASPNNAQLTMTNGSITTNSAANGGGLATDSTSTGTATLNSVTFTNNTASTDTGGIFQRGSGTSSITVNGISFTGNTSPTLKTTGGTINTQGTVNVDNSVTIAGGTLNTGSSTLNITQNLTQTSGTFNASSSTVNITGNYTLTNGTFTGGSSNINIGGNFTFSAGTFTGGTSTFTFNGSGAQAINGPGNPGFNNLVVNKSAGTLTLGTNVTESGNLTITSGIFDLSTFTANRTAAGGTLTVSNGTTLKIGGTGTLPSNFSTHVIGATSTIEYSGTNQNVATLNSSQKYGNLVTSGSGIKTLVGAIDIVTSLTIGTGTTLDVSASNFAINFSGTTWTNNGTFNPRSGTVTFNAGSGTQTLVGSTTFFDLTLNNSGATTNFGSSNITINHNLNVTAGTMDGGTSTIAFAGNPGAINGPGAKNFNNLVINSGANVSNTAGGNTTITNDFTNNGTYSQTATLTTIFATGADGNHSFSGNGTTTFGNFTINGSNTVDAGPHSFNVAGANFTVDGTFTGNTSTVTFNGGVAQAILGDGAKNFSGLTINNANGVTVNNTTPAVDASVSGALTLTTNLTIASGAILQQSGTSAGTADAIGTVRRTDLGITARAFGNPFNTISIDSGTAPTQLDVTLVMSAPPDFTSAVTRTYTITPTGGAGFSATVKLHYLDSQLNGNTESKLGLWKKPAAVWVVQGRSMAVDTVNNAVTLSGVTSFSDWTLADMPDVSVAVSPSTTVEDSGVNMVYTFTRTGSTGAPLTVNFNVTGTATFGTDYTQTGAATFTTSTGSVTIPAGSATAAVNIIPTADITVEPDETVILTVAAAVNYNVGVPASATGTITNDDTDVSVAVAPSSVAENSGTNLVYTFTRTGVTTGTLVVNFSIGGTATFSTDYTQTGATTFTPPTGTVTFTGTNTTATVNITPVGDNTVEPDETVILTVAAGTGYNVAAMNNSATGTITNDDADVSVAVAPSSVAEDGATNLVYTFTRTGFTGGPLTVNFAATGTATAGTDYVVVADPNVTFVNGTGLGTVMFTGTNTTATVTVDPTVDATPESNETVIITVAAGTNYTPAAPTSATGTILDDDTTVSVAVSPTSVLEDSGTGLVYTFTRTGDTSTALTVNFSVGGTATFTTDYTQTGAATFTPPTGTVTIGIGNTTAQVTVTPVADTAVEADETVILTVTAGTGYGVGAPSAATGTITNDDTDVSVAVAPSSVAENSGTAMVYTFTRTGVATGPLTVNFSIGGTATFTTDYTQTGAATFTPPTGTVTFTGTNTTATVNITPVGDNTVEPDETVILTVAAGTGYNVAAMNNSATGTITNDDADVSVAVAPSSVAEDGATNLVYTFTRTGFTGGPLTVNFAATGTATAGTDYVVVADPNVTFVNGTGLGTVMFTGTNTTATVTVDPTVDATGEANETVIITVGAGTNYTPAAPTSATGTINDDDTSVGVSVSPASVLEDSGTPLVYTFTRTGDTSTALTVNFSATGTASSSGPGADYTVTGTGVTFDANTGTGTVAIGSGVTTVTANVTPNADLTVESNETVIITVTAGTGYAPSSGSPSATGTITNDDTDVSVAVAPSSVAENSGTNLVYTFTRTGVTTGTLVVNFSIGGTATFSTDYTQTGATSFTPPTGTVTFTGTNTTATVNITPVGDNTVEPDETVILTVAAGTGYNVAAMNNSATGTITNDDADVSVAVAPSSVAEDGATNLVYTFTRTGFTGGPLTVNFAATGTATAGTDYVVVADPNVTFVNGTGLGTVMFTGTNTTATVTVDPTVDATGEANETVIITVGAGTNYTPAAPTSATGTINDDDTAVSVAVSPTSVLEDSGSSMTYTFTRTGDTSTAITVNFSIGGTATFTTDYTQTGAATFTPPTGTVTIGIGNTTAQVTVTPVADTAVEADETVILTVTAGTGYGVGAPSAATGTITNDDTDVSVAVAPSSVAENSGTAMVYTFTRTGVATGPLTVNFSIGGTATFSTDYTQTGATTFTPPTGTVTFTGSNTTATINITPVGDNTVEPDETVILTVAAGTGYNVAAMNNSATGTITNDDATVTVAVSPSSVAEDGATNLTYTFSRTGFTGGPLTVNFTIGGTATFTTDYTQTGAASFVPPNGTVTFIGTNTTASIIIDPVADGSPESNETVDLTLAGGTNYTVGVPSSASGTILDDDTAVTVAVAPSSVLENSGSSMTYTFTRTGDTSTAITVNFSIGGTATFMTDYTQSGATSFTPPTGTITIGVGSSMAQMTVTPVGDSTVEPDETVILTVTAGMGYNVGMPSSATGTITNDDTDVSVAVSPTSVAENSGTAMVYTFTRTGVTTGTLVVNFSIGGTATFTTDYTQTGATSFTPPTGTVTFTGSNTTATVNITPVGDSDVEPDETAILTVVAGSGYNVGAPSVATGTITNDDTDVTLAITGSPVGEDGSSSLVYTFTRTGVTSSSLVVNFTVGGTAVFTNDYTQTGATTFSASSGSVTITTGNTTAQITLTPVNDVKVEGNETVSLTLSASPNYDVGTPGAVTGTITDNDTATISFALSSSNAPEQTTPHNVGVTLTITANGTGTPMLEQSVSVNVQDLLTGTATAGVDYTFSSPQTVTFASGAVSSTQNVPITITNDMSSEGNETINLQLNTLVDNTSGQVSLVAPTSHTVTIVDNDIDLQVTKMESTDPVAAGSGPGNLVYTIKVKNIGLTNATGVTMSEMLTLPSGVTVDSVMPSAGMVSGSSPSFTWNIGNLNVNAEVTLTVTLTVSASAMQGTNVICDTASLTGSNEIRVNVGNDSATECTSIVAQADIEIISKTDAPDPVCVNGNITYTISFRNNGAGPGLNTKVSDTVPANTTFVSAMVTSGSGWGMMTPAVGGTGTVMFTKANVAVGETATFQVVVKVNAGTLHGTVITNTASGMSDPVDPMPANNSKMTTTTVDPVAPTITCPPNQTVKTVNPGDPTVVVNYPAPTTNDNCAVASVVCNPPSGSAFPVGQTTVTCTATDTAGNMASCTFKVTTFDVCLQDDSNPNTVLMFNSFTGSYVFCCGGTTISGTGTITKKGGDITLTHNAADRRVLGRVSTVSKTGTATLQMPPGSLKCVITDMDTTNNSCNCSAP